MTTTPEFNPSATPRSERPMLQITRLNHVRINAKILDSTEMKLKQYLQFANEQMNTKVTDDDVVEYGLKLLFEKDVAFRSWLKRNN